MHTLGTPAGSAAEEFADVTIDFVELTSKSPKVAHTLYRSDEAAYRVACGRTHALLVKKRKRPLRQSLSPDCLAMMQFGRGMKVQVGGEMVFTVVILQHMRHSYVSKSTRVPTTNIRPTESGWGLSDKKPLVDI